MKLARPSQTLALLREFGFKSSRALGQNFLVDENILKKIITAAQLSKSDVVLEIGAGLGSLTVELAQQAGFVIAVELDKRLLPILQRTVSQFSNCQLWQLDAMALELKHLKVNELLPNKMVSNLPYSIAASVVIKCLTEFSFIKEYIVMVQKEIAERMLAKPKTKAYSAYTVKLAFLAKKELLFYVPRTAFLPVPNVDSAVVKVQRLKNLPENLNWVFKIIEAAFQQRRKRLVNALTVLGFHKEQLKQIVQKIGYTETVRAEELKAEDYLKLSLFLTGG